MRRLSPVCSVAAVVFAGILFTSPLSGQETKALVATDTVTLMADADSPSMQSSAGGSASAPAVPSLGPVALHASTNGAMQALPAGGYTVRPFRSLAVQIKAGTAGVGIDLATPLARSFNLRVGGSVLSYSPNFNVDGMTVTGDLELRSATVSLDWFPFHGGFHISPGINLYNGDNLDATIAVPGGNTFSLGDGDYTSSASDPVHGRAAFKFGHHVAPMLTAGWGNMIPRSGRHFSVPFEIGFQYIAPPTFFLNLAGTACDPQQGCTNIATDPTSQANLQQEIGDINSDIRPLRFFPVVSIGASWKF